MRTCHFTVHGKVQGVGFRWWTKTQAERLAITGSVRNLPDGSVRVEATGPDPAVAELARLLHEGPGGARVARVEERVEQREPPQSGTFRIAH